jgi:hypothetical protein
MNASLARTFRISDRYSGDLRIDAANVLNHPVFSSWGTLICPARQQDQSCYSSQFGLPNNANAMRSVQTTFRVRF